MEFWAEAVNTADYIKNRCPTKAFDSKTPEESWIATKLDVSHLRVFGCKTFAHIPDEKRRKLESKSIPCVFLGYCEGIKAYRLMCLETKRIIKSRDVVFLEGTKEVEGVRDKRPLSNQIEHLVVDEVKELVKDVNVENNRIRGKIAHSKTQRSHKDVNNAWRESSNSPPSLLFIPFPVPPH